MVSSLDFIAIGCVLITLKFLVTDIVHFILKLVQTLFRASFLSYPRLLARTYRHPNDGNRGQHD